MEYSVWFDYNDDPSKPWQYEGKFMDVAFAGSSCCFEHLNQQITDHMTRILAKEPIKQDNDVPTTRH